MTAECRAVIQGSLLPVHVLQRNCCNCQTRCQVLGQVCTHQPLRQLLIVDVDGKLLLSIWLVIALPSFPNHPCFRRW
jgi:hypothetical protein